MRRKWGSVRIACLIVAAGVTAASCSSGNGNGGSASGDHGFTIAAVARSMADSRTARVRFTSSSSSSGTGSLVTTGIFDFSRHTGVVAMKLGSAAASVMQTARYVGGSVYVAINPMNRELVPPSLASGRHWILYDALIARAATALPGSNPFTALDDLRRAGARITDLGDASIDGQPVHRYRARWSRTEPVPPGVPGAAASARTATLHTTADVYIDARTRLVRLDSATTRNNEPAIQRARYDFSDYGVAVDVSAPAASDTVAYSTATAPTPRLMGPWHLVATGTAPTFTWRLFRAPADVDRVCWSFESSPPLVPDRVNAQLATYLRWVLASAAPLPRHDGHDATCTRTGAWQDALATAAVGTIGSLRVVVGIAAPDVVRVTASPLIEMMPGPTAAPRPSRTIAIDPRFDGFVDAAATASDDYTVRTRDGELRTCPSYAIAMPLGPFDPCAQLGALAHS
ncbi:MAG TPA: hypothetical protein VIK61_18655 [Acidimicrobiia bacterium]